MALLFGIVGMTFVTYMEFFWGLGFGLPFVEPIIELFNYFDLVHLKKFRTAFENDSNENLGSV